MERIPNLMKIGYCPKSVRGRIDALIVDCKNMYGWFYLMFKKTYDQHKRRYFLYRMRTLHKEGGLGDFNREVYSYSSDNE